MKTKKNLRQIAAALVLVVAGSTSAFAQAYTLPAVAGEATDTITIGSKAKYLVIRDVNVNTALFLASGFNWANSSTFTFEQTTGVALTSLIGTDAASDQNEVVMNAAGPVGTYNVTAAEVSRPIIGTGCVGNTQTLPVEIVGLPTMGAYGVDSGACAAPAVLGVPVVLTGAGKYDVRLHVIAYDLADVAIGAAQDLDLANERNVRTVEAAVNHRFNVPLATLTAAAGGAIPLAGCYFVITSTDLQDRFSKKNHNYNWVAHTGEIANADPDGADEYRYYVYPTPVTAPIQHIQNMY